MHNATVYTAHLEDHCSKMQSHWHMLSQQEQKRSSQFKRLSDRERFVVARSTLRQLLGLQLGLAPQSVVFSFNTFGKPLVLEPNAVYFNTSHSGDWVVHAISTSAPVGVDVEATVSSEVLEELQESVLSPLELDWILSIALHDRPAAFTAIWVRKEAYLKALGQGLNRPLRDISVKPKRDGKFELLSACGKIQTTDSLSLCQIEIKGEYSGALAYLGPQPTWSLENIDSS